MDIVQLPGAEIEVADLGSGEPVVFIQTALTADEFVTIAHDPALAPYRRILYHRRGYGGSSPLDGRRSIRQEAVDCGALLAALDIERVHIFGGSYSGAVALQVAADAPEVARSLVLMEPPPVHTPSAPEFRAANEQLLQRRREVAPDVALDEFLTMVIGSGWRRALETQLPGSAAQVERDVGTFFESDLPALLDWQFGAEDAARIACPVMHIGGTASGHLFAEVRELMLQWLPHAEDVLIEGAGHSMALTHAPRVAAHIADFLARHPMPEIPRAHT